MIDQIGLAWGKNGKYNENTNFTIYDGPKGIEAQLLQAGCIQEAVDYIVIGEPLLLERLVEREITVSIDDSIVALAELIKFLWICKNTDGVNTPSLLIDKVWHEFILFTRFYQSFCQIYFGEFVHHTPSKHSQREEKQLNETLRSYQMYFGTPSERFWGENTQASCQFCTN